MNREATKNIRNILILTLIPGSVILFFWLSGSVSGTVKTINDIQTIYLEGAKNNVAFNPFLLLLLIAIPSFLIFRTLFLDKIKLLKAIVVSITIGLLLYTTIYFVYVPFIFQKNLKEREPKAAQLFNTFQYKNGTEYKFSEISMLSESGREFSFITDDSLEEVSKFYQSKGFTKIAGDAESVGLWKHSGYEYGNDPYASIRIWIKDGKTNVEIRKLEHHFT